MIILAEEVKGQQSTNLLKAFRTVISERELSGNPVKLKLRLFKSNTHP